jgi:2'-hydroxyisoflavone reductase
MPGPATSRVPPLPALPFTRADRDGTDAYREAARKEWDVVIDVSRQPGQGRRANTTLADRAGSFVFVSSTNVYADHATPGTGENAALLPALADDVMASMDTYGQAKVACEQHVLTGFGPGRSLIARVGLIGGPGDTFDRTGYWPVRFRRPAAGDGSVLVPDVPGLATQVIDVQDLAGWLVDTGETSRAGSSTSSVSDPAARPPGAGPRGSRPHRPARSSRPRLADRPRRPAMDGRAIPALWLPMPEYVGFSARDGGAAKAAGLTTHPLAETLADTLAWELGTNLQQPRRAGLSDHDERRLLHALTTS